MEYYNSQCLLYNLVRENNLLKSQINKLNDIIVNNKSSTSENTSSENSSNGLSKDEVTQLIQTTDPKEHTHEVDDITDLNLSNYATSEQLTNKANEITSSIAAKADTGHKHTTSDITDLNLSNYATSEQLTNKANEITSSIAAKADTGHKHTTSDITDLNLSNYATIEHTHEEITNRINDFITDDNKSNLVTGDAVMNYVNDNVFFALGTRNIRLPSLSNFTVHIGSRYITISRNNKSMYITEELIKMSKQLDGEGEESIIISLEDPPILKSQFDQLEERVTKLEGAS